MTIEEKYKLTNEKDIMYNPKTDKIYGVKCNEIINKILDYIRIGINIGNKKNVELKGCIFFKSINKWISRIKLNNEKIHLGFFKTEEEEAVIAYNNAKENIIT